MRKYNKMNQKLFLRFISPLGGVLLAGAAFIAAPAWADTDAAARLLQQGQLPQALQSIDQTLAQKPEDPQARFTKGLILTEMGKTSEAIAVFQKLTQDYPELPEPYNNLAVLYAQQHQYERAKTALEMAIRTHPSIAVAHENLGDVYAKLASQAYDKALQLDSSNTAAQSKLALLKELSSINGRGGQARPTMKTADTVKTVTPPPPPATVAAAATPPRPIPAAPPVAPAATPQVALATPAARTETPTKAVDAEAAGKDTRAIEAAINDWAHAWSAKDMKAYLGHYDKAFDPPGRQSRDAWEKERTRRIVRPGDIDVEIEDLHVEREADDKATAKFRQHYRSASFKSSAAKTLDMVNRGGNWLILQERVGR